MGNCLKKKGVLTPDFNYGRFGGRDIMSAADDKLEIMDLIGSYSHAFDGGDTAVIPELFTDEGVLLERNQKKDIMAGKGLEKIIAFFHQQIKERGQNQPRHHVRNTIFVEFTDSQALTRSYFLKTNVDGPGKPAVVLATGVFEDAFIKTDKGWRIKKRTVIYDG
jgi:ketosteroid isomerase-like protein